MVRKYTSAELKSSFGIDLNREMTDGFAAKRASIIAKRMLGKTAIHRTDLDDIKQALFLRLWELLPTFDPARATWQGFVMTVMHQHAKTMLTARMTQKSRFERRATSLNEEVVDEEGNIITVADMQDDAQRGRARGIFRQSDMEIRELEVDVIDVLKQVPHNLQLFARRLKANGLRKVKKDSRCDPRKRKAKLFALRKAFTLRGLRPDFYGRRIK